MKTGIAAGFVSSLFLATALLSQSWPPQTPKNAWHYFHPVLNGTCQTMFGPDAQQDFTIGLLATPLKSEGPLKVTYVAPSGPAADAGIRGGDLLWGRDPNNLSNRHRFVRPTSARAILLYGTNSLCPIARAAVSGATHHQAEGAS